MNQLMISFLTIALMFVACTGQTTGSDEVAGTPVAEEFPGIKMITARITIKPEFITDFIEAAGPLIDSSNMESGCISYQLYQDPYDQTRFIMVEEWADQAAIDNHFNMPYFIDFGSKSEAWQSEPTDVKIVDALLAE